MTDQRDRWVRVNALFERAMEKSPEGRLAWLEEACDGDDELLAEVRELLLHDAGQTSGVLASVRSVAADLKEDDETPYIGMQVGNYLIRSKIADGGMGSVFLAEHAAEDFEQQVAIKLLPHHRLDAGATRRFVEERSILAGLRHPNIARLIDGGTLPDGMPYIVMDYIDGQPIDEYCEAKQLDNRAIIDLVLAVCDAVQYAHRKLVIHRDIKPGNILVDHRGVPLLLDFGIAKLIDPDHDDPKLTRAEQRVLTPLYASPEQIEGQPITTAADIYGLGLLLYRLLTGQMPYAPTGTTSRELAEAILSQTPEKPSTAVVASGADAMRQRDERWARRQQRALRGDLDTILLTALRKSPERRYASVAAMADDLRRYCEQRPILARRDSPFYAIRKFVARHRLPVSAAVAVIAGAIAMTVYYTRQLAVERDTAQQTATFLADLFSANDPYQRNRDGLTVEALLETGIAKLERDSRLTPLVRARLLTTIAQVQLNLGNIERADALATEALELTRSQAGETDKLAIEPLSVLSSVKAAGGDYGAARGLAERMLEIADATAGRSSEEAAEATHLLAIQAYRDGDTDAMGRWAEETYAIRKAVYPDDDIGIAVGATALGLYHWQANDLEKARDYYAESARIQELQAERNEVQYAGLLHNLALLYNETGDYATAVATYEKSIAIRRAAADERDQYLPYTLYALAHSQARLGDLPASHRTFIEAVRKQADVAGRDQPLVAFALTGYGLLLEEMGAYADAGRLLAEADRIFEATFAEDHMDQAATWIGLARIAAHAGEYDRGKQLIDRAIALRTETEGADDYLTLRAHTALGRLEYARGDPEAAAASIHHALDGLANVGATEHPFSLEAKTWLGRVQLAVGDADASVATLRDAVALGESLLPVEHVENVRRRLWLGEALIMSGNPGKGTPIVEDARDQLDNIERSWQEALAEQPVPSLNALLETPEA
jgi:serine/threonine-protein kinase